MVDLSKLRSKREFKPETDPVKIYNNLDKQSHIDGLRASQDFIVSQWYNKFKNQQDAIIKLPTGQGKTLIGLLCLQSILNEYGDPVVYLCPTTYLVDQTIKQAKIFGIQTVQIGPDNRLPIDFKNAKAILVTTCQKMFNGKSIFGVRGSGREEITVGGIVLDDAHKCLELIRKSFTIQIEKYHDTTKNEINPIYRELMGIFKDSLFNQASGKCTDVCNGKDCFMAVPYWTWIDNINSIVETLSIYKDAYKEDEDEQHRNLYFTWDLIKDNLKECNCVISGKMIEISPRLIPIENIPSFKKAKHRFFLSATLTEDAFLVKDLGIDPDCVQNPLTYDKLAYSGERIVLLPSKVNPDLDRDDLIQWVSGLAKANGHFGVVAIVPSHLRAQDWQNHGGLKTTARYLTENVEKFSSDIAKGTVKYVLVLLNAYDGIDLPDKTCRVLVLDSLPSYDTLIDKYLQDVRPDSKYTQRRLAQRIEQGMGRAIRGSSDWCILFIIGNDITDFFSEKNKIKYLSNEAQKQIEIGEDLVSLMKDDGASIREIQETVLQSLNRDPVFKNYYKDRMDELVITSSNSESYLTNASLERNAEIFYIKGQSTEAVDIVEELIANSKEDKDDYGWYLQLKALYLYESDKVQSTNAQIKAFEENSRVFRPISGLKYSKEMKGKSRALNIIDFIKEYDDWNSLVIKVKITLEQVIFENDSDRFEEGIKQVGLLLGFESRRPEHETGIGPDNLWNIATKTFWLIECKNEVDQNRKTVSKDEIGQMSNSVAWFKTNYEGNTCIPIFIHPATVLDPSANITDLEYVINVKSLELLRKNIYEFYKSLPKPNEVSEKNIIENLAKFKLDNDSLKNYYIRLRHQTIK